MKRAAQMTKKVDRTSYDGVESITIDLEANVDDNRKLYKSIMENSMKMIGSVSQQMVEFDNERKEADIEAGKKLHKAVDEMHRAVMDSTQKIESSVAVVEKEILEGQRHMELIQLLEATYEHAQNGSNHDPILQAIGNIAETDLSQVEGHLSSLGDAHSTLHDSNKNIEGLMDALHKSHGDLHDKHNRASEKLQGLMGSLQQSHGELSSKHDKANQGLQTMLTALQKSHGDLLSKHDKSNQSLQGMLNALDGKHGDLHSKHDKLLKAVAGIAMPDLDPLHRHMSSASEWMKDHGGRVKTMEQRLQGLEKSAQETSGTLKAIFAAIQDLSGKSLKGIQEDVKATRSAVQKDVGELRGAVGEMKGHFQTHRADVQDLLKKHSDQSLAIVDSHGNVVRELHGGLAKALTDHSKLMDGKFGKHSSDLLAALNCLPDHDHIMSELNQLCQGNMDDISKKHGDLFQAFDNHGRDVANTVLGLQGALGDLAQSHGDLHSAVSKIPTSHDHDKTADAVHRRLDETLKRLPELHDHDRTAEAVHARMEASLAKLGDHSHILSAIDGMDLTSHEKRVLEVIDTMQEASMTAILEAIHNISMNISINAQEFAKVEAGQKVADVMASARSKRPEIPPRTQSSYQSKPSYQMSSTPKTPKKTLPDTGSGGYSPVKTARCKEYSPRAASPPPKGRAASPPKGAAQRSASPAADGGFHCQCGFSAGTESAMQKHLERYKGERGHRLL